MYLANKKILAIIPARAGSKRLPKKNILPLCGKPLISWTIEEALKSQYISKIVVSSDDNKVLDIAKNYEVTYIKRDSSLASDTATSVDVVLDVINKQNEEFDYILLLQPTSPLRTVKHIDEAIELLYDKKANNIVSMCEVEHPIQWTTKLDKENCLDKFIKNLNQKRSQEQELHYRLNGAIYLINTEEFLLSKSFFSHKKSYAYIMNKKSSVDIDDNIDFTIAELLINNQ